MIDVYMIFGPPASGKSSLIQHFDEKNTVSTGNILRSMGLARADGSLVEDRIVNKILIENNIGIFQVPIDNLETFRDLLINLYKTNNNNDVISFMKKYCIKRLRN